MKDLNRILIQFDRAITAANSKYPQDKAIAVILFDNLIEWQLYKRAENSFMWSGAGYNGGGNYSKLSKNSILGERGRYDPLLKFSKDNKLITEAELEIIKFTHEIRNGVYHRGEDEELKIEVALLIYFTFLKKKLKDWGNPNMGLLSLQVLLMSQ